MAEATASKSNTSGRSEEEFVSDESRTYAQIPTVRELMDDRDALFLLTQDADRPSLFPPEALNKLISTVYSGPTIGDVEAALAMSCSGSTADSSGSHRCLRARIALPAEKGFNKMEGKFTMRVKCCSNGMGDDGYKWRKYGQKFIKNSPYPRSYYRCTNPRCNAKKQVERSAEDQETMVVTYEGLHLHYAFSHFPLPRPSCDVSMTTSSVPAMKRAKVDGRAPPQPSTVLEASAGDTSARPSAAAAGSTCSLQELGEVEAASTSLVQRGDAFTAQSSLELPGDLVEIPQGLLEDVVPQLIRKPCTSSSGASTALSDPSLFSVPSSPPSSSSSSPFSWPLFDDLGILSVPSSPASSSSSAAFSWAHGSSFFDVGMLPAGTV